MSTQPIISVVGGGWSFGFVDHSKVPGHIIAVNEAALLLRKMPQQVVSMDRLWTENRWPGLAALHVPFNVRRSALKNVPPAQRAQPWVNVFINSNQPIAGSGPLGFSDAVGILNGNNSGVCGINLAYIQRPKELYLFGFDMCRSPSGNPYWYPPYPWTGQNGGTKAGRYQQWAFEFEHIAEHFRRIGTKVLNVSAVSKITAFKRVKPSELGMAL